MAQNGSRCAVSRMYSYMTPSYVPENQQAASYRAVLDAVVENSSAHGLPTFYRAIGRPEYMCIFASSRLIFIARQHTDARY